MPMESPVHRLTARNGSSMPVMTADDVGYDDDVGDGADDKEWACSLGFHGKTLNIPRGGQEHRDPG